MAIPMLSDMREKGAVDHPLVSPPDIRETYLLMKNEK